MTLPRPKTGASLRQRLMMGMSGCGTFQVMPPGMVRNLHLWKLTLANRLAVSILGPCGISGAKPSKEEIAILSSTSRDGYNFTAVDLNPGWKVRFLADVGRNLCRCHCR